MFFFSHIFYWNFFDIQSIFCTKSSLSAIKYVHIDAETLISKRKCKCAFTYSENKEKIWMCFFIAKNTQEKRLNEHISVHKMTTVFKYHIKRFQSIVTLTHLFRWMKGVAEMCDISCLLNYSLTTTLHKRSLLLVLLKKNVRFCVYRHYQEQFSEKFPNFQISKVQHRTKSVIMDTIPGYLLIRHSSNFIQLCWKCFCNN
jgi:hypothetical protein